ncbi:hypothetical protein C0J50_8278 [Silurus asotus]|uniref:Endonuclease/exonuclease/phosphatase domain-containing protein n=1 Tax=Silurus asotus TaxID=30991 RepID=A0AAD5B6G9_SILAS|nr:hypothetical protein C0J50_8278 [Silurus asotus]
MTGKGREVADMVERRKVDMLCVQETKWKGFIMVWMEREMVCLKEEHSKCLVEVKKDSERVMNVKLEVEEVMFNVISALLAPQVGYEMEEKETFWSDLGEMAESELSKRRLLVGADFNWHVGEGNIGDEEVMCRHGLKEKNVEEQMVVILLIRWLDDVGMVNQEVDRISK